MIYLQSFFLSRKKFNIQFLTSDVENLSLKLDISAYVQYFGGWAFNYM